MCAPPPNALCPARLTREEPFVPGRGGRFPVTQDGKQAERRAHVRRKRRPCGRASARRSPDRCSARPRTRPRPPPGTESCWGPQGPFLDCCRPPRGGVGGAVEGWGVWTSKSMRPLCPQAHPLPLQPARFKPGREICSPAQPRLHRNPHLFRILFQKQFKPHPPQSLTQGVFTPTLLGPLVKSE